MKTVSMDQLMKNLITMQVFHFHISTGLIAQIMLAQYNIVPVIFSRLVWHCFTVISTTTSSLKFYNLLVRKIKFPQKSLCDKMTLNCDSQIGKEDLLLPRMTPHDSIKLNFVNTSNGFQYGLTHLEALNLCQISDV